MTERRTSRDFLYVHTDIPAGMTIRAWRAERVAADPAGARRSWVGMARALARPRIARVRVPSGRRRAPRPAAPPSPGASA
jgi:hypothetical protein